MRNILLKKKILVISPVLVLLFCQAVALLFGKQLGAWVWAAIVGAYWILLSLLVLFYDARSIRKWFVKPKGNWIWPVLAFSMGMVPLPVMFIANFELLRGVEILVPYIILAVLNPFIEEFYWRGVMLDVTDQWPSWLAIGYTSVLFSANHAAYAWQSVASRSPSVFLNTIVMGVLWALVYKHTKSLRWCIFSHFLVNAFSLSVPVFLNLYIP